MAKRTRWKIVETSSVTDESLEGIVNELTGAGWTFEGIQFAMRESSKRPAMAFVLFTRAEELRDEEELAPALPVSGAPPLAAGGAGERTIGSSDDRTLQRQLDRTPG